ncbi:MAG: mannonate dehydratase, partial [Bacteroidota bacterium]
MKKLEQTWRWYGPEDPVSLADIRQAGASGIVTALHQVPNGAVWPLAAIAERKTAIEKAGLRWSVVESLPVSEAIKQQKGDWKIHLEHYRQSLQHLGECGIRTVTYNFMPVLDWTRTDLDYPMPDGSTALRFDRVAFAAFDLFILQRPDAATDYPKSIIDRAKHYFEELHSIARQQLTRNIIAGLPGAEEGYTIVEFRQALAGYTEIDVARLRQHLIDFLAEVIPTAEKAGVQLAIHPDDPPYSVLGLPRVVSRAEDLAQIFAAVRSPANGLCFCTGSFGVRPENAL